MLCSLLVVVYSYAQSPMAAFTSDVPAGCAPLVVHFTDQSSGGVVGWQWDLGNGATSTDQNPSATYFNNGTYTITLTVHNAGGTTNTVSHTISVLDLPTAEFSADKLSGCSPVVTHFTDMSSGASGTTPTQWLWDFGDGQTSTEQNPVHTYISNQSYTVTLTINNAGGCKTLTTKPNYINVTPGVKALLAWNDPGICRAPETIQFNNISTGPGNLSYNWLFGDGQSSSDVSPSHTYMQNGIYHLAMAVTSDQGCTDSFVTSIQIGTVLTNFNTPEHICPRTPVIFENNSAPRPIHSNWSFSNGAVDTFVNGSTTFINPGTYTVTLVNYYNSCVDSVTKTITVLAPPQISFSPSDSVKCQPSLTVNFSNSSNGTSYQWEFGDGSTSTATNPSHTYTSYGDFSVTLIALGSEGCSDSVTRAGLIHIRKPTISFPTLPESGCIPDSVSFSAQVNTYDQVTSYLWNFGTGGATSTGATPTFIYTDSGTYNVSLTVTTSGGCTETYTLQDAVRVGPLPTPQFTSDLTDACADPGIHFINQSQHATDYLWQFGDGSTSADENPQHIFQDTGWVNVSLTAINNGCQNKITKTHYAHIKPAVSRFKFRPDCTNPLTIMFTNQSIGSTTWNWNFGDGATFSGQNPPAHTYATYGTYEVTLTSTNGNCTHTLKKQVAVVNNTPDFSATVKEGCKPLITVFSATAPDIGIVKKYKWDYGDGSPLDTGVAPAHIYLRSGFFTVKLTTVDSFGCQHILVKNNYIRVNGPTANFTSHNNFGCRGRVVNFLDSTQTDSLNQVTSWRWNWGDSTSTTYTAPPFQHQYDSSGDYDVSLIVTDSKGCTDSVIRRGFVRSSYINANFRVADIRYQVCPMGANKGFTNLTLSDFNYTSQWDFGDGQTSTDKDPLHMWADTGFYVIKLIATDYVGCSDTMVKDTLMHVARPKAAFDANNFVSYCVPFKAKFINQSYFMDVSFWDLSNGTSEQYNPTSYYTSPGTYNVKLVVTAIGGCKDSVSHTVTVHNPSDAQMTYTPLAGCSPMTVNFNAFSQMYGHFIWDFGDGAVIDTSLNAISHLYHDFGDFVPRIILKQPDGCVISLVGTQTIHLIGAKAKFAIDRNLFCDNGFLSPTDSTTANDPITSYNWNFGDSSSIDHAHNPTHHYTDTGAFNITLVIQTQHGCADTFSQGPIKVVHSPFFNMETDTFVCIKERVPYKAILAIPDSSVVSWKWTFPNGNFAYNPYPPDQVYTTPGDYSVTAIATNGSGCADTVTKSLKINPLPDVTAPAVLQKVVGVPIVLPATYSAGVLSYQWSPAKDLNCSDCPQPVATPNFNTTYVITATDTNGCHNSTSVQIITLCKGATVFMPNAFSPNGDGSNDILYVRGNGLARIKSLRIFNRWGEVVFEKREVPANDPSSGWDGIYKNQKAQPDVYIYQLEVYCENSEVIKLEGNVALIK